MPVLERTVVVDAPVEAVWAFHLDTRNAARIAPPGQEVRVLQGAFPLVEGAEVVLRVRQRPLPVATTWRIRIARVVEPTLLVDELVRGPFRRFRHEHRFAATPDGRTRMTDRIEWALPLGPLGRLAEPLAARLLLRTFARRQAATRALLGPAPR